MQAESKILNAIRDKLSRGAVRLFRNNVGTGLMIQHKHGQTKQAIISECIALAAARGGTAQRLSYGLQAGSADLIGWRVVEITPDMVGRRVAVFLSCEVKTATGPVREEQERWAAAVNSFGGDAFIARSVEDASRALDIPFKGV